MHKFALFNIIQSKFLNNSIIDDINAIDNTINLKINDKDLEFRNH